MILDKIIEQTKEEVTRRSARTPLVVLQESPFFFAPIVSLKDYLLREGSSGVIAEIKRASPSAGTIKDSIDVEALSIGYMQAGAAALSILTEPFHFRGSLSDLSCARRFNFCPILRKDFIIEEYQLFEARAAGADVVLLIRRLLDNNRLSELIDCAHELGLEVLLEVHSEAECDGLNFSSIDLLGINNRDLDSLTTSVETSFSLKKQIPEEVIVISESGISDAETMRKLSSAGFKGFLIGEAFMSHSRPEKACEKLIREYLGSEVKSDAN